MEPRPGRSTPRASPRSLTGARSSQSTWSSACLRDWGASCRWPGTERRPPRLDIWGMAAATTLIGGLVFALIQSPADGWHSPLVLTAAGLAVAGLLAFVFVERATPSPLLPPGLYRDPGFLGAAAQGALFNFAFYGLLFALSLMLQQGRDLSALSAGLLFLPLTGVISLANLCAAPLARRFRRRAVLAAVEAVLTASLVLVAWASTAAPLWPLVLALIPAGFSAGLLVATLTSEAIGAVEPSLHGAASAAFNTARQVGGAVGVATLGPLLGTSGSLGHGFTVCLLVGAAATATGFAIAAHDRLRRLVTAGGCSLVLGVQVTPKQGADDASICGR